MFAVAKTTHSLPLFGFSLAVHAFKIKILEDWNDDLKDKKSAVFRDLASRLETEVGLGF